MNQGTLSMLVLLVSSPLLASCTTKIMRSEFRETEFEMHEAFPNDDAKHAAIPKHGGMQPFPASSTAPEDGDNSGVTPGKMTSEQVCDPEDPESICGGSASVAVASCQNHLKGFDGSSDSWRCTEEGCENTNRAYAAALKAAGRTVSAPIPQSNRELGSRMPEACTFIPGGDSLAQSGCFNPKTADPDGWCCDCLAKVQEVCGGVDNKCFHEFMCDHPKVHKDWKAGQCKAEQAKTGCGQAKSQSTTIDKALPGRHGAQDLLMDRQHSAAGAEKVQESGLDEALEDKCSTCSR